MHLCMYFSNFKRKVPDSIPGRACRPNRSKFSVVFSEPRVNTGQDSLGSTATGPGPTCGQLALSLQPTNQPMLTWKHCTLYPGNPPSDMTRFYFVGANRSELYLLGVIRVKFKKESVSTSRRRQRFDH